LIIIGNGLNANHVKSTFQPHCASTISYVVNATSNFREISTFKNKKRQMSNFHNARKVFTYF